MACCVALTLIFAWTYRLLRWFGLGSSDDEFAPAASWPPVERATTPALTAPRPRHTVATALIVVGLAWFGAGLLAMHVFDALPHIHSATADVVFHGSGLWLATAGLALRYLYRPTLHRPKLGTAL